MQLTKDQFKNIRNQLGYTQAKFSEMLGITIRMITYYETGQKIPSKTVSILAKKIYHEEIGQKNKKEQLKFFESGIK